jgi:hypothetical protein
MEKDLGLELLVAMWQAESQSLLAGGTGKEPANDAAVQFQRDRGLTFEQLVALELRLRDDDLIEVPERNILRNGDSGYMSFVVERLTQKGVEVAERNWRKWNEL